MRSFLACLGLVVFSVVSPDLLAEDPLKSTPGKPSPTEIHSSLVIYGRELLDQWAETTPGVNLPPPRAKVFPGQGLIVAVSATGEAREGLLQALVADFTLTHGKAKQDLKAQRPALIRSVKAQGADFVNNALGAAGVSNPKELESKLSLMSVALFDLGWTVPTDAPEGDLHVAGSFQSKGKTIPFKTIDMPVISFDHALTNGNFKDPAALGAWSMTYYQHPEPPRLLNAFRMMGNDKNAFTPNLMTFYVEALKASPPAASWIIGRLKGEERGTRLYGFLLLREAGMDISKALSELPEEDQKVFAKVTANGSLLPNPYDLSVKPDDPIQLSSRLDMLWSIFIATGSAKPVRAIASALEWRDDWKLYLKVKAEYQKTGKGPEKMTPELLRASAYGAAGWSLGSFYRNHGLATDHIEAMKVDPKVSEVVKEELRGLIGNPAFKMQ